MSDTTKCTEAIGPDPQDPTVYLCNRKQPHTTLHAELGAEGEPIAIWCTCPDCKNAPEDLS